MSIMARRTPCLHCGHDPRTDGPIVLPRPRVAWNVPKEDKEAAAGALLVLGSMLYEWGLPLDRALEGLRRAYEMEAAKQIQACRCHNDRDRELCKDREHCAEVRAFAASVNATDRGSAS